MNITAFSQAERRLSARAKTIINPALRARYLNALQRAEELLLDTVQVWPVPEGYEVASRSRDSVIYTVKPEGDRVKCSCPAGVDGQPCKHAAIIAIIKEAEKITAQ